jgi:methionyl-tRNA formyltransferase
MLRVIFMGTAELACASLKALRESAEFQVAAVVTQPDRPRGRNLKPQPSAVKALALESGLEVLQPLRAREPGFVEQLRGFHPDAIVVAAYGQILPQAILDIPKFGCVNVHTSLLPKYRGAAPIQWAILDGEPETGVTIMRMAAGLDTGDILSQRTTPIRPDDDAAALHDRLAEIGAQLLTETLLDYVAGKITPQAQDEAKATYARKITKEDGLIDWKAPARVLHNRIRAFTPWPGAFTYPPGAAKRLLKIWKAIPESGRAGNPGEVLSADAGGIVVACGDGALRVLELQNEGGRRLTAAQFLNGHPLLGGDRIG